MTVRSGPVRYGVGAWQAAPQLVADRGARRVLLVCGRRSFTDSGAAAVLPALCEVAQVRRWSGFAPNPEFDDLHRGLAVVDEVRPDLVLAVGGGSALDTAKLLCAFADAPRDPDALAAAVRTGRPAAPRRPWLVAAPTTSGSGSQATHFAVVYLGDEKVSVAHPSLRPDAAILDPGLTRSGSAYQRASSGIDAVAQAVESWWSVDGTDRSRRWARHALGLLLPALPRFVADPGDDAAARATALGSHLAGRAIDVSRTTAAHALSYALTRWYGISHGHAVGLTLGRFLAVHGRPGRDLAAEGRLAPGTSPEGHDAAMAGICAALGATGGSQARDRFEVLMRGTGLDPDLAAVGVRTDADRAALAAAVNPQRLANNPVTFTTAQLQTLLDGA